MTRGAPGAGTRRPAAGCPEARRCRGAAAALLPAGASLLFGAAGHTAAGGGLPGAGVTAAALAVLTALNTAVAARVRRHAFRAAVLGAAAQQVLLHLAFHASTGPPAHHPPGDGSMPHPAPAPHHAHDSAAPDAATAMGAAHALATLGAVVVLLRGERLLRHLARLLARGMRLPVPAGVPCPETVRVPKPSGPPPLSFGALLARARGRRGPPR